MFIYWCRKCTQQRRRCRWGVAAIYTRQTPALPPSLSFSLALLLLTWRIRNLRQAARNCIFNRFYIGFYSCSYIARVRESERQGERERERQTRIYMRIFREGKNIFGKSVSFLLLKSARIFAAYFRPAWPANVPLAFHFR